MEKREHIIKKAEGWYAAAPLPEEECRLLVLEHYRILETKPDKHFDNITQLLSTLLGTSFAFISLIDKDRQWFKSAYGIDVKETPRDQAFCAHAIGGNEPFIVLDALTDERFRNNPLVCNDPHIRFYAGMPLIVKGGYRLGTLCALDTKPHESFGEKEAYILESLTKMVVDELDLHLTNIELVEHLHAKTNFLTHMSHAIRTPMNDVVGMASLLEDTDLNKTLKEYVSIIQSSSGQLLDIINEMLDVSQIEVQQLMLDYTPFDLKQSIEDIMHVEVQKAKDKGVEFIFNYSDEKLKYVLGDPLRIRQVVMSLLNNAVKFTDEGYIKIHVLSRKNKEGGVTLRIEVEDSGIGLSEEQQQAIFSGLIHTDMATVYEYNKPKGLGLTICHRLITLMDGKIGVDSTLGHGSTFWVELTLPHAENKDDLLANDNLLLSKNILQDSHILVAEDNVLNQKLINKILQKYGCKIDLAGDGEKAISQAMKHHYAAIIMDCHMPDKSGYEVTRILRETNNNTPIIALISRVDEVNMQACLEAGANDFIGKPIKKDDLIEALCKWVASPLDRGKRAS